MWGGCVTRGTLLLPTTIQRDSENFPHNSGADCTALNDDVLVCGTVEFIRIVLRKKRLKPLTCDIGSFRDKNQVSVIWRHKPSIDGPVDCDPPGALSSQCHLICPRLKNPFKPCAAISILHITNTGRQRTFDGAGQLLSDISSEMCS